MIGTEVFKDSIKQFFKPIEELIEDGTVSEIMINGPFEIWVEQKGVIHKTEFKFPTLQALESALTNISQYSQRPYSIDNPILETHLPDGSRVEAVMEPIAMNGPVVSIRRFSKKSLKIEDLVKYGTLTIEAAKFLAKAVGKKKNIIVSGGTGSGKTSLLCALSSFISPKERIVVVEDTHELELQQPHCVYLESRTADDRGIGEIRIRDLLHATMRLRPDRIVVGEIRGIEAVDMVAAMTSGHEGSMTTIHANNPGDALGRLETLILMDNGGLPHFAVRAQLASAVDIIVQITRMPSGKRAVTEISMVSKKIKNENYVIKKLFTLNNDQVLEKQF
jgi:pilus assembly protein CpaF